MDTIHYLLQLIQYLYQQKFVSSVNWKIIGEFLLVNIVCDFQ